MSDPDSDPEAAAMAAAMGFSSFGSAPAKKKRKFNAATDAFVEGQKLEDIDRGGKKGKGSGGNSVALGKARVLGSGVRNGNGSNGGERSNGSEARMTEGSKTTTRPVENDAEIELEEGGDGSEEERPNYVDTSLPAPVEQEVGLRGGQGGIDEEGPAYHDTSTPPPSSAKGKGKEKEVQENIDAILASSQPAPIHNLPARPPPPYVEHQNRVQHGNYHRPPGIPSVRQSRVRWYEGYYDQTFNTNPWEWCEEKNGLSPVGSWLFYGHWNKGVKVEPPVASNGSPRWTADGQ